MTWDKPTMQQDLTALSPPVAVSGLVVGGVQLNNIVLILTAVYTVLLIIKTIPVVHKILSGWITKIKGKRRRHSD